LFNPHIKEIFELFRITIKTEDIIALFNGTFLSENLVNLYFKILDKMNMVLLTAQNFQSQTPSGNLADIPSCEKVMFCSGNFVRRMRKASTLSKLKENQALY